MLGQLKNYLFGRLPNDATKYYDGSGNFSTPAGSGGGGLVLIEQQTVAAAATIDLTSWFSSTYDDYLIELIDILNVTNNQDLRLQFSTDGGATWETASNYYYGWGFITNTGSFSAVSTGVGNAGFFLIASVIDNANGGVAGTIKFRNPGGTAPRRTIEMDMNWAQSAAHFRNFGFGTWALSTAVDGIRLFMQTGNITGTVRIYGLAK